PRERFADRGPEAATRLLAAAAVTRRDCSQLLDRHLRRVRELRHLGDLRHRTTHVKPRWHGSTGAGGERGQIGETTNRKGGADRGAALVPTMSRECAISACEP